MPTYIMLSTLTPEGVQTVKNNPQRITEVNKEVEQLGATVKAQWATLGHVDFISVVEAPDEATMARVSLELGSRGTGRYETLAAIGIEEFIASLKVRAPRDRHADDPDSARGAAYAGGGMSDYLQREASAVENRPVAGPESEDDPGPSDPSAQESRPDAGPGISLVPELMEEAEVQAELDDIDVDAPRVGIVMGSKSDMEAMEKAAQELEERGILHEIRVMSAHREPDVVADYARNAHMRGLRVIIAGAGISAALPGAIAAHTDLPVIGVPLSGRLSAAGGLDAILSIVQMPPGVPVACVGLDNARNAAILAAQILGA
jgi:phosphoribosylaminoimidazole carboxylase PurE protein